MLQKKITDFLFSTRLMAILFIVFAAAMGVATFLENSYSTEFARIYVYNTKWFELIMVLFVINFLGNIKKYNLLQWKKWHVVLLHFAWIVIIIGAGVTRYISYEGMMPIREGEASNTFYSAKTFLTSYIDGKADGETLRRKQDFEVLLAAHADNDHTFTTDFKGQNVTYEITQFIHGAKRTIVPDPNGERYLKIVEAGSEGKREDHFLREGTITNLHNILFAFNKETEGAINIQIDSLGNYTIHSPFGGDYMRMADRKTGLVYADSTQQLMLRSLYSLAGMKIVFPNPVVRGHFGVVHDSKAEKNGKDAVFVIVTTDGKSKQVTLLGSKGRIGKFTDVDLGGLNIHLRYGSKEYKLPFKLELNDFIAKKYPGTASNPVPSYSSFKSKVTLIDDGHMKKHDIYMNHVLNYDGYRFFQSSFFPDENGTVLSVNHDFWGTNITYIGYYLLYLGLMAIMFIPGSRFKELEKKLSDIKKFKKSQIGKTATVLAILFLAGGFTAYAQSSKQDIPGYSEQPVRQDTITRSQQVASARQDGPVGANLSIEQLDSLIQAHAVPKRQAADFSKLVIQDYKGRMKPINTFSSELLRKLSRSETYNGLNSDQVLLSMTQNPLIWYNVPLIHIKSSDDSLHNILGIKKGQTLVKLTQFFDADGTYKLIPYLEEAYRSKVKSQFQKDVTDTDGRVNLLFNTLQGKMLRIFPLPNSKDNKWVSFRKLLDKKEAFSVQDSLFSYVTKILPTYIQSLNLGHANGDYTQANTMIQVIQAYQKRFGAEVMPSESHIEAEIAYNKYDVFKNLYWEYLLAGVFMFIFVILQIFYNNKGIRNMVTIGKIIITVLFVLHTVALIVRWYISGHAPWADAYESMIYVAWATMFFGLAFGRKSDLTIASTAFVASIILFVAHLNWLNPAIANLEPVLDSYWIMIHTSVIVASYGPFTLGMILGIVSLFLMIMTNKKNKEKMRLNIKEITIITEMALTIGLIMLTIGNFLGGQWANESWGRYWSWDPKETWALVSIIVYAFVIHMRLVPGLRNRFAFNWAAIIAYGSILMTYFGVNFYLSGMHSYASGDEIISYKFIIIAFAVWLLLGLLARPKFLKYYKKGKNRISV